MRRRRICPGSCRSSSLLVWSVVFVEFVVWLLLLWGGGGQYLYSPFVVFFFLFQFASLKFLKHSYANFMAQIVLPLKILPMHPTGNLSYKLCHTDIVHIMATALLYIYYSRIKEGTRNITGQHGVSIM